MVLAGSHQLVDAIKWAFVILFYAWIYQFRFFDIEMTFLTGFLLFIAQDFCYYWFHRTSHRVRWLWAAHVVHHSSTRLNLSTAFRQSIFYPIAGMWVFWTPLALVGFEPAHIILVVSINLGYQFFVHTQAVGKLGFLEKIFNTPSHHRVHHAKNDLYIDRNYAGVLIIWDKLFGTFVEEREDEPCVYGITRQIHSHNPFFLWIHEWKDMFIDAFKPGKISDRLKHFWKPPEWQRNQEPID